MIVIKKKTVLYFVQMTAEQRDNLISAIVAVTDNTKLKDKLSADEFESVNDLRISLLNA